MATATKTKASSTTIPRLELLTALLAVAKAVPARAPKPILQNVRIGDGLVSGTDLEIRIDATIGEHCEAFLVPCERLVAILRAATGDEVTFTLKGQSVTVACGRGSWTLPTEDVAEYPTWEPEAAEPVCRLPADQFVRAARAVTYATDNESSRYALGAVLVEVKDGNPTWVATDGRRLSYVETETDQAVDDRQVLIPARLMGVVSGLAHGDGSVQVTASAKECTFELDGFTVTGRLTDGKFPRWRDVVGDPEGEPTVVDVQELLAATRAAAIVTSEQSKGVDFAFTASGLGLHAQSAEAGESMVTCEIVTPGSTANVKLDPRFVVDFCRNVPPGEEPHVDIYAKDAQSRVLLRCGPYTGVIMPLDPSA